MAAVSSRYARALADAVTGSAAPAGSDSVEQQLQNFVAMTEESADLRNILISPAVAVAKKKSLIAALGDKAGLTTAARNFLYVLVDHKRIALLPEILPLFRADMDERQGQVEAHVTSATELAPKDRASLEAAVATKTGKRVRASYQVDPALIGGVVTRVGSTVYDGSVREHLRMLRKKLSSQ
jgi:F-type H+-transporting ATPase subunit delta